MAAQQRGGVLIGISIKFGESNLQESKCPPGSIVAVKPHMKAHDSPIEFLGKRIEADGLLKS